MFPGGRQEARRGGCSMCWEGGLLSSPWALGQLLRKEGRAARAMKVLLRLGGPGGGWLDRLSPRVWGGGPKWQGSRGSRDQRGGLK